MTGVGAGSLVETWAGGGALLLDLNTAASPNAAGRTDVQTSLFSTTAGFGWNGSVTVVDSGAAGVPAPADLYRDYHTSTATATFSVLVGSSVGKAVTVHSFRPSANLSGMRFQVEGGAVVARTGNATAIGNWVDVNRDGILTITVWSTSGPLNGGGNWTLNGIDIV